MNPKYRSPFLARLFDLSIGSTTSGIIVAVFGIGTRIWSTALLVGVALIVFGFVLERGLTYWEDKRESKKNDS
jgi:hypothetical protein